MSEKLHTKMMNRCYELAEKAKKEGESPVGSVVVLNEKIIGEGIEMSKQLNDVTRHAEVVAILDALKRQKDLSKSVLYTNVEPCALCAYVIRHYRIKTVVFAKFCGELGGLGKPFNILSSNEIRSWAKPPTTIKFE